jgi:hypothetical protein
VGIMTKTRRLALVSLVALTALLTLGACAPATHTQNAGGHPGGAHPGATSSPSPKPTRHAVAVAPPRIRVPLSCAQIAPATQVTSVLSAPEVLDNTQSEKGTHWWPWDLEPYASVQDGALVCNYETSDPSDLTFYRAYVMPDAPSSLWAPFFANASTPSAFTVTPSPFGANSTIDCEGSYHNLHCGLEMLIGTTWVSLYGYSDDGAVQTVAQAAARFQPLFSTAVNAVTSAAIAEPRWSDPAATAVNVGSDFTALDTALTAALGSAVSTEEYQYGPDVEEATDFAVIPVHLDYYQDYVGNDALNIQVLPQGAWAWSAITAAAASEPGYATMSGLGDKAVSFTVTGGPSPYESVVVVDKGHNLFSVEVDTSDVASGAGVTAVATNAAHLIASKIG